MGMEKVVAGIDEAGRGSVIGPMVIAGVSIGSESQDTLLKIKVKDSKLLSPKQREVLAKKIEKIARDIVIVKLSACRIDNMRKEGVNLNRIEAMKFADIVNILNPDFSYIDCPDTDPQKLTLFLKKMLKNGNSFLAEHKADVHYPIVSAASIIAKVSRDEEVKELHKKYGDFGPGYSSNEKTIAWMREWLETHKDYPDIVRRTWITAKEIRGEKDQKSMGSFFRKLVRKEEECGPKVKD